MATSHINFYYRIDYSSARPNDSCSIDQYKLITFIRQTQHYIYSNIILYYRLRRTFERTPLNLIMRTFTRRLLH